MNRWLLLDAREKTEEHSEWHKSEKASMLIISFPQTGFSLHNAGFGQTETGRAVRRVRLVFQNDRSVKSTRICDHERNKIKNHRYNDWQR